MNPLNLVRATPYLQWGRRGQSKGGGPRTKSSAVRAMLTVGGVFSHLTTNYVYDQLDQELKSRQVEAPLGDGQK